MSEKSNKTSRLIDDNPEVKSYMYQLLTELEPFVSPQTVVAVVARDPKKLKMHFETNGIEMSENEIKKLHRVAIVLSDDGAKVEAEGWDQDIYKALYKAKENLVTILSDIHDKVISNQERMEQINTAISGGNIH